MDLETLQAVQSVVRGELQSFRTQLESGTPQGIQREALEIVQLSLTDLRQEMVAQVRRMQSPWLDRQAAADYAHVTPSKIDQLAREGELKRYGGLGDARYKKTELDGVIAETQTPKNPNTQVQDHPGPQRCEFNGHVYEHLAT